MLKTNQYFEGKVASIAFSNDEGNATVGVMDIGEYTFGTTTVEYMTVVSGCLKVQLPGDENWKEYHKGETFVVPANEKFHLIVEKQSAYTCFYE